MSKLSELTSKTALLVLERIEQKLDEVKEREEQKEMRQTITLFYWGIFICCLWIAVVGPAFYGVKNAVANFPNGVNIEWNLFPRINWQGIDLPPFTSSKKTEMPKPGNFSNPVPNAKRISSRFGYRSHPVLGGRRFHNGIDLAAPTGTPILASLPGKVVAAGWLSNACGNGLKIEHPNKFTTSYCHLDKINVKKGVSVNISSTLGTVGSTGRSTGPHLHFTVRKDGKLVNPETYFRFDLKGQ
jgi:murein DD-endopeptidase MepM/ murein hydrolase activator NlpD